MRNAGQLEGFADLTSHREEKVRLGNALAMLSAGLAEAQEKVRNERTFAQPATSLLWLFERIARLNGWVNTFLVVTDV